jgi:hypothetical protein
MSPNPTEFHDDFLPQDSAEDDSSLPTNTAQPFSQAELEDLLYGDSRSVAERLTLLRQFRADLAARAGGDIADDDPTELIAEIDQRIVELESDESPGGASGTRDVDPLAHRETLAPDSDELEAIEDEDEASLDEEDEWLDEEEEAEDEDEEGDEDEGADYRDAVDADFEDDERDEEDDEDD